MLEIPRAKTVHSGNPQITFILHCDIVTCPRSHIILALSSSATLPPSSLHQAHNQYTVATQGYPSYGLSWQAYNFPQGGYGGPQMFPHQQQRIWAVISVSNGSG
jgi:hypothetical protein